MSRLTSSARRLLLGVAVGAMLPATAAAQPFAVDYAFLYLHDIRTGCPDFRCQTGTRAVDTGELFTEGDLPTADTGTQRETVGGNASLGRVGFTGSGSSFLPALSVFSRSDATSRVRNVFAGVQRYTVGSGVSSLTVNGELTFTSFGVPSFFAPPRVPDRDALQPQGWAAGVIYVWSAPSLNFGDCISYDPLRPQDAANCFFVGGDPDRDPLAWPGLTLLGKDTVENFTGDIATTSLSVSGLTPGQTIFVGASLTTVSAYGGFVDARNTFRLSFDTPDAVTAAVQRETFAPADPPPAVPEPATTGLLAFGLTGLAVAARRRNR